LGTASLNAVHVWEAVTWEVWTVLVDVQEGGVYHTRVPCTAQVPRDFEPMCRVCVVRVVYIHVWPHIHGTCN
jgi:hypothetical protein